MDYNTNGLKIEKPAGPSDAYEGGLHVTRDARFVAGGTPGHVNVASYCYTRTGVDQRAFEWNYLTLLDNYSNFGENCAAYDQTNVYGAGASWGRCIEICDAEVPSKNAPMRSLEVDVGVSGPDNGQRYGIHIVASDGPFGRKGIKTQAQATFGIYGGAGWGNDWVRWMYGFHFDSYINAGLHLRGNDSAIRGIHIEGKHIVSVDLSGSEDQTTIRMKAGQRICFDGYDDISLSWEGGRLRLKNRNTPIFEIDTSNGDVYKRGVKVL
jgi:hypothetical protein